MNLKNKKERTEDPPVEDREVYPSSKARDIPFNEERPPLRRERGGDPRLLESEGMKWRKRSGGISSFSIMGMILSRSWMIWLIPWPKLVEIPIYQIFAILLIKYTLIKCR